MSNPDQQPHIEHIAVIAMAGKFPGACTIEQLWLNLCEGKEAVRSYSDDELLVAGVDPSLLSDPHYVKAGTVLDDAEKFDAAYFGLSAREAEVTDPQHRLFLETAHEALERAGYDPQMYRGLIGVFAGTAMATYWMNNLMRNATIAQSVNPLQVVIGNDKDFVPSRVSYKLGLRGPSVNVQTACSTSLVAVHLACQSLLAHECDMAIAGGVSVRFPQGQGYMYEEENIFSPDGHCRPFDAKARGTFAGNGTGVVVLKRYSEALADGDRILARILGSAINNDGSQKIGYTAPGVDGQADVIAAAQAIADVDPVTISYVETHGTGTLLGDPIEITALTQAFRAATKDVGFCAIGSVKSNLGHLDAAAGVTGLIKTVLQLHHKKLVPSLHFEERNPKIDFARSPFFVSTRLAEWALHAGTRRAGVSSFGFGGTNAHVVLADTPDRAPSGPSRPAQVITMSAKTSPALEKIAVNLAAHLRQHPEATLADVGYTLHVGRTAHPERTAFVASDINDAISVLEGLHPERMWRYSEAPQERPVVFMFPGGGAQFPNMGRGLFEAEEAYRVEVDRCAELFQPYVGVDLRELMYPSPVRAEESASKLKQTGYGLPALFATEYAHAKLWMSWGIRPDAMIGHSLGEYVAACVAGAFTVEDAVKLVATRSRLMETLPKGAMVALNMSEAEVLPFLGDELQFAAINGPSLCVVSGRAEAIAEFERKMQNREVECRRLHIDVASHCKLVEPMLEEFTAVVRTLRISAPKTPYISNVTGTWITAGQVSDPNYWARHLRSTVRFADGISELMKRDRVFLEVGPGHTLTMLTNQHPGKAGQQVALASQRHPRETQPDVEYALNALALLWASGARVDWSGFHHGERRHRLELPTYPFERQSFWVEPLKGGDRDRNLDMRKRNDLSDFFYVPLWKQSVSLPLRTNFPGTDLVFDDGSQLASEVVARMRASGREVVTVVAGNHFEAFSQNSFRIEPCRSEHYDAVLKDVRDTGHTLARVTHLWSLAQADADPCYERGVHSLLFFAQAVSNVDLESPIQLTVVTNNLHRVGGEPGFALQRATVLGPCRVIPQEYSNITVRTIDVDITDRFDVVVNSLAEELRQDPNNSLVALRGRDRWTQWFRPVRLPTASAAIVKEGAAYLLTGGLGGMALEFAEHLANAARVRIVLMSRSEFPARSQWPTIEPTSEAGKKIARICAIEASGSEVMIVRADVGDEAQVRAALERAEAHFGPIRGVIHAAGLPGGGMIQLKSPQDVELVLRPKVEGTLVLAKLLAEHDLDFLFLCSSLSRLAGGVGHVDYCAANAFLGVWTQAQRHTAKYPVICVDWNAWQGVGMATNVKMPEFLREWQVEVHSKGITAAQGKEAFDRIIASRLPQIAVSTQDLELLIEQHFSSTPSAASAAPVAATRPSHSRPNLPVVYVAPRSDTERTIAAQWETLLGVEPIGIHDNFFALGGHSLLGTKSISRLRDTFGVDVRLRQLFEKPTVAALAEMIEAQKAERTDLETQELVQHLLTLPEEEVDRELARRQAAAKASA